MINNNYLICYDLETISAQPETTEPCQISAVVLNPRTLEIVEGGEFNKYVKPTNFDLVQDGALEVNRLTREQLKTFPEQEHVIKDFAGFCDKYTKGKKPWGCVVPMGFNICNFDNIIMKRMFQKYGIKNVFHPIFKVDVFDYCWYWFESLAEVEKLNLDYLRGYFGISKEGSHEGLKDAKDTAMIGARMLKFARQINERNRPKFKGAFATGVE